MPIEAEFGAPDSFSDRRQLKDGDAPIWYRESFSGCRKAIYGLVGAGHTFSGQVLQLTAAGEALDYSRLINEFDGAEDVIMFVEAQGSMEDPVFDTVPFSSDLKDVLRLLVSSESSFSVHSWDNVNVLAFNDIQEGIRVLESDQAQRVLDQARLKISPQECIWYLKNGQSL